MATLVCNFWIKIVFIPSLTDSIPLMLMYLIDFIGIRFNFFYHASFKVIYACEKGLDIEFDGDVSLMLSLIESLHCS